MLYRIKLTADATGIARSIAISAVAIALCVYAMTVQIDHGVFVLLAAIVLLLAAGAYLQVSHAVRQFHYKHGELHQAARQAEWHYFKVLRRIMAAIEAREHYTRGRSKRIGFLAKRMGEELGLDANECHMLYMAGQVHDIGLLAVPDYVLNKASRLGSEEYRAVKDHAEASYRILRALTIMTDVLPAIRYHHERMNGTGYPHALKGEEIPLSARIMAVADSYDAMTHDRPHRSGLPPIEALGELRRCSPAGYDSQCVSALEEVMDVRKLREVHGPAQPAAMQEVPVAVS